MKNLIKRALFGVLLLYFSPLHGANTDIVDMKGTCFFKKDTATDKLYQVVWVKLLHKTAGQQPLTMQITSGGKMLSSQQVVLKSGENSLDVLFPDLPAPAQIRISFLAPKSSKPVAEKDTLWHPQKKWTLHCVTYSHHDLGYGGIPHRLRRENRMENMELMLKLCAQTDDWPDDAKYRAVLETSEPLTTWLSFCNKRQASELAQRIREGRIQIGGIHTTVNTEMLGHELMARLFYLSGRHVVDLFGVQPSVSANFDDVIGITLPFFTYTREAGIRNLFHGYNNCSEKMKCMLPAQDEPVFYMQSPDGVKENPTLVRSYFYAEDDIRGKTDDPGDFTNRVRSTRPLGEDIIQSLVDRYDARLWPFDVLLAQDGYDFKLLTVKNAERIRRLNENYAWPRMICSTMDMFFADVRKQIDRYPVKTFEKDGNNQWADQPASDAKSLGIARRTDELLPVAEKFAAINKITGNAAFPWTDLYQAYHRLLIYHEHTVGACPGMPAYQYPNEQQEVREMADDAAFFTHKTLHQALDGISAQITTGNNPALVVFNPMNFDVSQPVVFESDTEYASLSDNATGREIPLQKVNGKYVFNAADIPATGYKTYTLLKSKKQRTPAGADFNYTLENDFYVIRFDSLTGGISSLFDKELHRELIDENAPYKLNDYLYERYEILTDANTSQFYGATASGFDVKRGAVADVITVWQKGEGSRSIKQTITAYRQQKRIDFRLNIDKSASGRTQAINNMMGNKTNKEALYVALPFSVPAYRFKHSLPWMSIEPVRQQFDSVATASYAVRHFASVANDDFGITVAPIEAGLVQYGHPRSDAIPGLWGTEHLFEKNPVYPESSSMFLYLLNNMFDVNLNLSQSGEKEFSYSLTSYAVKNGYEAEKFGWEIHNPPLVRLLKPNRKGNLPAASSSFITTDKDNVVCTTFKPAEENGDGYILRLVEISGQPATATVSVAVLPQIDRVEITDLVENNSARLLEIENGNSFRVSLPKFGVQTLRLTRASEKPATPAIEARALSDMRIRLTIDRKDLPANTTVKIYRDTTPAFRPSLLTYVGDADSVDYVDAPVLNFGNWINNVLEPDRKYFYRAVAYDRWNNRSGVSEPVECRTLPANEANDRPQPVAGLKVILVSDVSPDNYLNVHWLSNCEPDITAYEVYRGANPAFAPDKDSFIGKIDVTQNGNGSRYPLREYDHQMYPDYNVKPAAKYYYKVCAVDSAGQKGAFAEAFGRTKTTRGKR